MKGKRWIVLTLLCTVMGAGVAYASSPWGDFQGFTKVKVTVNGNEAANGDVPAFVINGRAVLPMRDMTDSMQGLLRWDDANKTAEIYKPNVNMIVARDVVKDSIKQPFGIVKRGDKLDFVIVSQVDNLKTGIDSFKTELVGPNGAVVWSSSPLPLSPDMDSFWYDWKLTSITFDSYGEYKVRFLMKIDEADSYSVVAEKVIKSE